MPYVDIQSLHNPATGNVAPASWGDQIRDNLEFLISPPSCKVNHSTTQNVSHNTDTVLLANSESWDTDSMHSTSSSTSRITINTAGKYLFIATAEFGADATGMRRLRFKVNGSATQAFFAAAVTGSTGARGSGSTMRNFSVGDYIEVEAHQNSGSTLTCQLVEFSATWVGR